MDTADHAGGQRKSEAQMRKNTIFAIAATSIGVAMILWARSIVVATHAEATRPKVGSSPYIVMPNPYLPIRPIEEVY